MVDDRPQRRDGAVDVGEVEHPARLGVQRTLDVDVEIEREAVHVLARVTVGHLGQPAGGLESNRLHQLVNTRGGSHGRPYPGVEEAGAPSRNASRPASGARKRLRMRAFLPVLLGAVVVLAGCGGSASETPFPQSPDEISVYPAVKRPRPPGASSRGQGGVRPPPSVEQLPSAGLGPDRGLDRLRSRFGSFAHRPPVRDAPLPLEFTNGGARVTHARRGTSPAM